MGTSNDTTNEETEIVDINILPEADTVPDGKKIMFIDSTDNSGGTILFEKMRKQIADNATDPVARAQIANLAKLPAGSTTGDAELADIRVGANGKVYGTAGEAVRGQLQENKEQTDEAVASLKEEVVILNNDVFSFLERKILTTVVGYSIREDGKCEHKNGCNIKKYSVAEGEIIYVKSGTVYQFQNATQLPETPTVNPYIVGDTVSGNIQRFITVPIGATFICVNENSDGSGIFDITNKINSNACNISDLSKQLSNHKFEGHDTLSEKEIFDMCKFSSLEFTRVVDYNETWSSGAVDTIEGEKYFRATSNGNVAWYYTRQQKSFKQYIHLKVICDNPKDIEYVKIMLSPVSGSTVNRATFDITDRIKSEENYLILNRCDSDATQYTAWDAIESTDFVVKAKSDKSVNVRFGVISTYNRKALCSITFDDGHITHYINAYPYMEANNIRGEIAMITDNVGVGNHLTQKQLADLIAHGWDIGSHTKNHIHLSEVSEEEQEYQLLKAKEFLIGIHAGKSAGFVTPPYGSQPTDAVLKKVCTVRRYAVDDYNNQPITDSYRLKTFSIKAKGTTVEEVKEWIDYAIQNQLWLVLTFHMIMDSEIDWAWKIQNFKDTIDYLVSNSDVIDTVSITEGLYKQ